ncbi:glycosyltransferase family 4 protein [Myxococcus qinghaiensis]|uniref:glycosyltransferase family 4 protein n=1 Tax=Myxococcus qinghaiensis TaxID=2906758 RepID=UPI0020A7FC30|nr:glycosyltransferase family 4 protein [Myxococcus qinghaiensis]MCP3164885.1 glycosyltransferase family 4 protein [Myxococcus qinghaiensis]
MRALHVYSGNLYGGIESFLVSLARVSSRHPEGTVHEYALCFEGRLADELRAAGATVHLLGHARVGHPWTVWRTRRALGALLKQGEYSAVVCHAAWPQALFGPVARAYSVPLVFFQHDALSGAHWLERWASVTPPDLVLSNSAFTARSLERVYPRASYRVRHPLVPEAARVPEAAERTLLRADLGAGEDDVVIIHASRMQAWKGHRLLLEALGRMREARGWRLWIAGGAQREEETRYLDGLVAQSKALGLEGRVRFLGQRSDVPRLLRAADLHCQPNTSPEPFGLAFVEALQAGLPVVTTALGGPLEIVDETCGRLVAPEAGALASALLRLVVDAEARRRLGAGGPARAAMLCAPEAFLASLDEDLRSVVSVPGVAA